MDTKKAKKAKNMAENALRMMALEDANGSCSRSRFTA